MGALLMGLLAAGLALAATAGESKKGATGDGKKPRGSRRMSAQDAFLEGKKSRDAELKLETAAAAEREASISSEVAKRLKADQKAAKLAESTVVPPEPETDVDVGGDGEK